MINAGTKIISAAIIIAQVSFFVTGFLRRFSFISFSSSGVTSLNIFCLFIEVARYKMSWFYLRSEEHTSELQSRPHLVCRLLLEKKKQSNDVNLPELIHPLVHSLPLFRDDPHRSL